MEWEPSFRTEAARFFLKITVSNNNIHQEARNWLQQVREFDNFLLIDHDTDEEFAEFSGSKWTRG